jgi:hypothetical protein
MYVYVPTADCYYLSDLTTLNATIINGVSESWNRKVHCRMKLQIVNKLQTMIDKSQKIYWFLYNNLTSDKYKWNIIFFTVLQAISVVSSV